MEEELLELVIAAVITAVRKDLTQMLMDTECCKWSKRRMKKLCDKLQKRIDDRETIEEALEHVRTGSPKTPKIVNYANRITMI